LCLSDGGGIVGELELAQEKSGASWRAMVQNISV
jgi:hypothetical protein